MPIAKKNDIPKDFLDQMKNNLTKSESPAEEPAPVQTVSATSTATAPAEATPAKKEKYADVMNVRLSPGRRNEIKTFCSSCGISITQYIESSFEFLASEVAAGHIVISKGGIKRVGEV